VLDRRGWLCLDQGREREEAGLRPWSFLRGGEGVWQAGELCSG
jgi:hypothetical protein